MTENKRHQDLSKDILMKRCCGLGEQENVICNTFTTVHHDFLKILLAWQLVYCSDTKTASIIQLK